MSPAFGDEFILALTVWREASNQGIEGMQAVACVVRNRAQKWGGSIYSQCVAANQFSSLVIKGDPNTVRWPPTNNAAWIESQAIACSAVDGSLKDVTSGALYYWNAKIATSGWFKEKIASDPAGHPLISTIGDHEFYA